MVVKNWSVFWWNMAAETVPLGKNAEIYGGCDGLQKVDIVIVIHDNDNTEMDNSRSSAVCSLCHVMSPTSNCL